MTETTTIEITREQWKELNSRKEPGDSMKDVIDRLLSDPEPRLHRTPDPEPTRDLGDTPNHQPDEQAETPVEQAMGLIDLPGQGERNQRRREAFSDLLGRLYEQGETNDLYEPTYENYATGYESVASWRTNAAGPALSDLADRGIVECVDQSRGVWRWVGFS